MTQTDWVRTLALMTKQLNEKSIEYKFNNIYSIKEDLLYFKVKAINLKTRKVTHLFEVVRHHSTLQSITEKDECSFLSHIFKLYVRYIAFSKSEGNLEINGYRIKGLDYYFPNTL